MKIRCQGKVRYFYFCDDYGILRLQPCNRTVPCNRNRMLRVHISGYKNKYKKRDEKTLENRFFFNN